MTSRADDERVLVWAPRGRDSALAVGFLQRAGFRPYSVADADAMCAAMDEGAGCVLLTEEVLTPLVVDRLVVTLSRQPAWSDLPIVVLGEKLSARPVVDGSSPLGNVTFLDRPVQVRTLITAVRVALRSRERQYAARTAIRRRDEFLAMLGHELRNPLAAIVFATEMLDRDVDGPSQERRRGVIARQARHLCRLVDDLLDVSRVTTGKVVLRREPLDLVALVERCVQQVERLAAAKHHTLELRLHGAPAPVDVDPVRMEQVVVNLLTNAIKYTPTEGHLTVEVTREGSEAVLRVRDDGIGIEPELGSVIFDLFAQAPSGLDRSEGGLGLGLTVVRSLVTLHGGRVSVRSEGLGKGSEFVVRLPARPGPTLVRPVAAHLDPEAPLSIVLVDDNEDMRDMLEAFLTAHGHRVQTAADGHSGLAMVLASAPDVGVIDIGLPGIDGYELARRVRDQLGDSIRLIAITGYGQPEDRERTRAAGFDVHLVKPAGAQELIAALMGPDRASARSV
jgi:signal transduction histidine kinase/CheY-like chemotaxis protein